MSVKLLPLAVKLWDEEAVPAVVLNPVSELGETTIDGIGFPELLAVTVRSSMLIFGLEPAVPFASPLC